MAWPGELPLWLRLSLLAAAVVSGFALYRLLERPLHQARPAHAGRMVWPLVGASLLLLIGVVSLAALRRDPQQAALRRENVGLSDVCMGDVSSERWQRECRSRPDPRVMVWGDSHAMHLASGVAAEVAGGVVQATMPACPPTLGLAWYDTGLSPAYAQSCLAFNRRVLARLDQEPSVEVVVVAAALHAFFLDGVHGYREGAGEGRIEPAEIKQALAATVAELRRRHKRVVFVQSPPSAEFDIGLALERRELGFPLLGPHADVTIPRAMARARAERANQIWAQVAKEQDVEVITFDDLLCDQERCRTMLGTHRIYRDNSHLSIDGALALAKEARLGERIESLAR
jgi:hypothetical protein